MAGQIPINFVTHPAVSLKAACFGNNVYDNNSTARCFSNLLAVGYRRLLVDLYWSADQRKWSFCPVSVPSDVAGSSDLTAVTSSTGSQLYQLGPYLCTPDLDVSGLIDVLDGYFKSRTSQLNVYLEFVIFNLHAAASAVSPDQPASAVSGSQLPGDEERLGFLLHGRLGKYIYGPSQLADERSNLNNSWYKVTHGYKPITEYFTIHEDSKGRQSTPDGWPCSKYVQLAKSRRALLGYGDVDPQLNDYNLTSDNVLFPPSYLSNPVDIALADDGSFDSGCFYDQEADKVSQVNSSWAETTRIPMPLETNTTAALGQLSNMVSNVTACGLSPFLNSTLFSVTADTDIRTYRNISLSADWAWAVGQPRDSVTDSSDEPRERCAVLDLSTSGHWAAIGCDESRRAACRVGNRPFTWQLSTENTTYSQASKACPENTSFEVPRTALENTYLYRYTLSQSDDILDPASADSHMRQVWIDLNSMDIASCWVSGGPDASCPYASDPQQLEKKTVLVATIWGIVICVVAALTLFVKCNANRRNSRRRKRIIEGWEYEGVPS